jgi:hypothetical protein
MNRCRGYPLFEEKKESIGDMLANKDMPIQRGAEELSRQNTTV